MPSTLNLASPMSLTRDMDDSALSKHLNEWGDPRWPGSLATPQEWCEHWHFLDKFYNQPTDSALHHDYMCELHSH